jgi:hypothetical protein
MEVGELEEALPEALTDRRSSLISYPGASCASGRALPYARSAPAVLKLDAWRVPFRPAFLLRECPYPAAESMLSTKQRQAEGDRTTRRRGFTITTGLLAVAAHTIGDADAARRAGAKPLAQTGRGSSRMTAGAGARPR